MRPLALPNKQTARILSTRSSHVLDSLNERFARAEMVMGIDQHSTGDSEYAGSEPWNTSLGALVNDWLNDVQTSPGDTQTIPSLSRSPERSARGSKRTVPWTDDQHLEEKEPVLLVGIDVGSKFTGMARKPCPSIIRLMQE